jgi:hypothetical protein
MIWTDMNTLNIFHRFWVIYSATWITIGTDNNSLALLLLFPQLLSTLSKPNVKIKPFTPTVTF